MSKIISLEIPDDLREAIRLKAFKENTNVSKFIRQLLRDNLVEELKQVKLDTEKNKDE